MAVVLFCMNANATELNLNEYKGKVVYLDFWASWCGPCKESFPWLNKLAKENKDLVVIGVNLDKDKSDAEAFLKKYPADFKVVYNPKADLAEKYKVKGMPYTIIFDKEGNQKFKHIGFSLKKADEYMREIKTLQNEVKK
jgi:thiol-disulfide isomerase/thioredoxin